MLKINWVSPLPPARTGIATYSRILLPHLAERARIRLFTFQESWDEELEAWGPVRSLLGDEGIWKSLNASADVTIFHLGNNADFHALIWQAATVHPAIVVLHDPCLQHLFAAIYLQHWQDKEGFLSAMEECHGAESRQAALRVIQGKESLEELATRYPMTRLAVREALAIITHSQRARELAEVANERVPSHTLPLPFPSRRSPLPERPVPGPGESFRLVIFGHLWPNRRLEPLMRALAGLADKDRLHLDVYGRTWDPDAVRALRDGLGLASTVTLHGWVDDRALAEGLERAHLAINLRDPSMGEASLSQLQIYSFALPSLVTQKGWYASLDARTVRFVRPETEIQDIRDALRDLLRDPERFAEMGRIGARVLRESHSAATYAEELLRIAEKAADHQSKAVEWKLAAAIAAKTKSWKPAEQHQIAIKTSEILRDLFADTPDRD